MINQPELRFPLVLQFKDGSFQVFFENKAFIRIQREVREVAVDYTDMPCERWSIIFGYDKEEDHMYLFKCEQFIKIRQKTKTSVARISAIDNFLNAYKEIQDQFSNFLMKEFDLNQIEKNKEYYETFQETEGSPDWQSGPDELPF